MEESEIEDYQNPSEEQNDSQNEEQILPARTGNFGKKKTKTRKTT